MEISQPPPVLVVSKGVFRNWRIHSFNLHWTKHSAENKATVTVKESSPLKSKQHAEQSIPPFSPQVYLDIMIRFRGYGTNRFKSLQTGYYNKPTPLQRASYGTYLVDLVAHDKIEEFREIIAAGISPNPCNASGESILHMVCRHGQTEFLVAMLQAGASVQVCDDSGRTPLHDACLAAKPCFDVVKLIMQKDSRLFYLADSHGALPLSYVPRQNWAAWLKFLESVIDDYWPEKDADDSCVLTLLGPNTKPLPNPLNALTEEAAAMVACGKMKPGESRFLLFKTDCEATIGESDWEEESNEAAKDGGAFSDEDDESSLHGNVMSYLLHSLSPPTH